MAVRWQGRQAEPAEGDQAEGAPAAGPTPMDWLGYAGSAIWRHRLVAGVVLVTCVVGLVAYFRVQVPLYRVETRILAQRQQALPSISRPTAQDDAPTRAVWDVVHRRATLRALIASADLLKKPDQVKDASGPKEWLAGLLGRGGAAANPEEDRLQAMVNRLDRALLVTTTEATITISLDWPDPDQAYRLVEDALQNFLEARHLQEVTALDEGISLLQGRAAVLREQLDRVVEQARGDAARRVAGATRPVAVAGPQSDETVQLKSMLEAKVRTVSDIEEFRRRRLTELQGQLDAQKAIYSDAHPNVISLQQDIAGLSKESPQVVALREEIKKLRAAYVARTGQEPAPVASVPTAGISASMEGSPMLDTEPVRQARFRYQQMVERVSAAQTDLDAARAAFKYRYTVVWPAQPPRKPVSPSAVKILGAGTLASLLLAIMVAVGLELRAGKVVARWQVEHQLELPVLGELDGKD